MRSPENYSGGRPPPRRAATESSTDLSKAPYPSSWHPPKVVLGADEPVDGLGQRGRRKEEVEGSFPEPQRKLQRTNRTGVTRSPQHAARAFFSRSDALADETPDAYSPLVFSGKVRFGGSRNTSSCLSSSRWAPLRRQHQGP